MSLGRTALDGYHVPRRGIAGECAALLLFFASSACFSITDSFPFSCARSGVVQTGETQAIGMLGVTPSLLPPSLTLFGAEIGLSLFHSYRAIHSLVLVGLPVAGIAPAPQPD